MSDQNIPEEQLPAASTSQPESGDGREYLDGQPVDNQENTSAEIPVETIPPSSPTVIVTSENKSLPKWFYFFFLVILLAFIVMTSLLVLTLSKRQILPFIQAVPTPTVTVTPTQAVSVTLTPVATLFPTPTLDPAVVSLNKINTTDEIKDLELDVANTDFSSLEESLKLLDSQVGFSL